MPARPQALGVAVGEVLDHTSIVTQSVTTRECPTLVQITPQLTCGRVKYERERSSRNPSIARLVQRTLYGWRARLKEHVAPE